MRGARGEREKFFSREKKFSLFPRIISPYRKQKGSSGDGTVNLTMGEQHGAGNLLTAQTFALFEPFFRSTVYLNVQWLCFYCLSSYWLPGEERRAKLHYQSFLLFFFINSKIFVFFRFVFGNFMLLRIFYMRVITIL